MIKLRNIREVAARCVVLSFLLALCACGQAASSKAAIVPEVHAESVSLALVGYNYTNRHIDSFTVDGQGGGNLYVSSPTSGGGGTACCVEYWPGTRVNTVTIRWQSGACYYHASSPSSPDIYDIYYQFYKEREVTVADDVPADAKYMEVHFFPDGSVKAAVTASTSRPRLLLRKDREDHSTYPRCPNDKKPE